MSAATSQPMRTPSLIDQLKRDEGLRLKPYADTQGKVTIGYGHNLTDIGITPEMADYLLVDDIHKMQQALSKALPWTDKLDGVRLAVLQNMAFNLGVDGLLLFRTFLTHVQAGRWQLAASAMLASEWAEQVGKRAHRLAQQMDVGLWC